MKLDFGTNKPYLHTKLTPTKEMPRVALVFRRPYFVSDYFLVPYTHGFTHVDILPLSDGDGDNALTYTSYMGENFSISIAAKHRFTNQTEVALCLELADEEHEKLTSYLQDLCAANVPYNYTDLAMLVVPAAIRHKLLSDVPSEDPAHLQSVFCSQAAVLALRNALLPQRALFARLNELNSRETLPVDLNIIFN